LIFFFRLFGPLGSGAPKATPTGLSKGSAGGGAGGLFFRGPRRGSGRAPLRGGHSGTRRGAGRGFYFPSGGGIGPYMFQGGRAVSSGARTVPAKKGAGPNIPVFFSGRGGKKGGHRLSGLGNRSDLGPRGGLQTRGEKTKVRIFSFKTKLAGPRRCPHVGCLEKGARNGFRKRSDSGRRKRGGVPTGEPKKTGHFGRHSALQGPSGAGHVEGPTTEDRRESTGDGGGGRLPVLWETRGDGFGREFLHALTAGRGPGGRILGTFTFFRKRGGEGGGAGRGNGLGFSSGVHGGGGKRRFYFRGVKGRFRPGGGGGSLAVILKRDGRGGLYHRGSRRGRPRCFFVFLRLCRRAPGRGPGQDGFNPRGSEDPPGPGGGGGGADSGDPPAQPVLAQTPKVL